MKLSKIFLLLALLTIITTTAACAHHSKKEMWTEKAHAEILPRSGSKISGNVTFEQKGEEVLVKAEVKGLKPNSSHGFHVHEFGDCSAPDAASAGSHFNPHKKPHGGMTGSDRHVGDMQNIIADAKGVAVYEQSFKDMKLCSKGIVGRAVIVHEKADDLSQPVGNAGGRIGCGVIGIAKK